MEMTEEMIYNYYKKYGKTSDLIKNLAKLNKTGVDSILDILRRKQQEDIKKNDIPLEEAEILMKSLENKLFAIPVISARSKSRPVLNVMQEHSLKMQREIKNSTNPFRQQIYDEQIEKMTIKDSNDSEGGVEPTKVKIRKKNVSYSKEIQESVDRCILDGLTFKPTAEKLGYEPKDDSFSRFYYRRRKKLIAEGFIDGDSRKGDK